MVRTSESGADAQVMGLEGVVLCETELSGVDGERGELVLRGVTVAQLAEHRRFEAALGWLWHTSIDVDGLMEDLGSGRQWAFARLGDALPALAAADPMDALRGAVAVLPDPSDLQLVGAMAVFVGAWWRLQQELEPVPPDPRLEHAADLLRMLEGTVADAARVDALATYLCTVVDHGMNASTFVARVVASTGSDATSAVVGALGALKGPLHGGAPGPVLDMLDAIATLDQARPWLVAELEAGRRIMGMGHRVYRVRDPRAAVLQEAALRLALGGHGSERVALARGVEDVASEVLAAHRPERNIAANVEFWTALLLEAVGLDRSLYTAIFACSRVVGWLAHVEEQRRTGRLIRPRARYVGSEPAASMRQ